MICLVIQQVQYDFEHLFHNEANILHVNGRLRLQLASSIRTFKLFLEEYAESPVMSFEGPFALCNLLFEINMPSLKQMKRWGGRGSGREEP